MSGQINERKRQSREEFIDWYFHDYIPNVYVKQMEYYKQLNEDAKRYGFHLAKMNKYMNALITYKQTHPMANLNDSSTIAILRGEVAKRGEM